MLPVLIFKTFPSSSPAQFTFRFHESRMQCYVSRERANKNRMGMDSMTPTPACASVHSMPRNPVRAAPYNEKTTADFPRAPKTPFDRSPHTFRTRRNSVEGRRKSRNSGPPVTHRMVRYNRCPRTNLIHPGFCLTSCSVASSRRGELVPASPLCKS